MRKKKNPDNEMLICKIKERLTIYEIGEVRLRLLNIIKKNGQPEIDIEDVNECDTAGIQLLCSAIKSALNKGKEIRIVGRSKAIEEALSRTGIALETVTNQ